MACDKKQKEQTQTRPRWAVALSNLRRRAHFDESGPWSKAGEERL
jgi:hypothetical protein